MTGKDPNLRKADLHIHTPSSVCYSDGTATPKEIVEAALAAGLDIIAITDHNSASGIEAVQKTAEGTGLYVFPGIELTTKSGHFLALFDGDTPVIEIDDFLDYVGIEKDGRGNARTVSTDETLVILKKIHERGGLAVAAHIDRWPSGLMESSASRSLRREIHDCEYLDALEITIPKERKEWENGEVRNYPRKLACIQGSDAHSPEEIARRPVYVRMKNIGLIDLKNAFLDYENALRFPNDISENC
jgi:PHP family Zn ribbon phosphoesterase